LILSKNDTMDQGFINVYLKFILIDGVYGLYLLGVLCR